VLEILLNLTFFLGVAFPYKRAFVGLALRFNGLLLSWRFIGLCFYYAYVAAKWAVVGFHLCPDGLLLVWRGDLLGLCWADVVAKSAVVGLALLLDGLFLSCR